MRSGHLVRASARIGLSAGMVGAATLLGAASAGAAPLDPACVQADTTVTCTYTADDTFVVPTGVTSLQVLAVGGNGSESTFASEGEGEGGAGDALTSDVPVGGPLVAAGDVLTLTIGGNSDGRLGGANGGGDGGPGPDDGVLRAGGGGGGGATEVTAPGPAGRIVVAGGGGGGGVGGTAFEAGGDGGSAHLSGSGRDGMSGQPDGEGGAGGTGSSGGAGGVLPGQEAGDGEDGSASGTGGDGGTGVPVLDDYAFSGGGGGGAGYTGGGGGGGGVAVSSSGQPAGGGGGAAGESYTAGSVVSREASDGVPRVVITYQAAEVEAVSDDYETKVGTLLTVSAPGVFDNDTGSGSTFTVVDDVDHGTLVPGADGAFTYQPDDGYVGLDTFTYSFADEDAQQTSNDALVRIVVGIDFVGVEARCGEVTFTNLHDEPIYVAYGTIDIIAPDGELDLEPGESRTVETDRAELYYLAGALGDIYPEFDAIDVPQDCPPGGGPGAPGSPGGSAGGSGGNGTGALPSTGADVTVAALVAALVSVVAGAVMTARRRATPAHRAG